MSARYPIAINRVGTRGAVPHLWDPELRTKLLLAATGGMSRRGVARSCGVGAATLCEWLQRGQAEPETEPYASFSRAFLAAERVLEAAGASVLARKLAWLQKQPPEKVDARDLAVVLHALEKRYPRDHGAGQHREPEPEIDGKEWLDDHSLTLEQLRALLSEPPPEIERALLASADTVVARLLAGGWKPSAALCDVVDDARRSAAEEDAT